MLLINKLQLKSTISFSLIMMKLNLTIYIYISNLVKQNNFIIHPCPNTYLGNLFFKKWRNFTIIIITNSLDNIIYIYINIFSFFFTAVAKINLLDPHFYKLKSYIQEFVCKRFHFLQFRIYFIVEKI